MNANVGNIIDLLCEGRDIVNLEEVKESKVLKSGEVKVQKAFTVKEFDEDDGWVKTKIKPGTYKYRVVDFNGWKPRQLFIEGDWIDVADGCKELEDSLEDTLK